MNGTEYQEGIFLNRRFYNLLQYSMDNKWQSFLSISFYRLSQTISMEICPRETVGSRPQFYATNSLENRKNVIKVTAGLRARHIFQESSVSSNNTLLCVPKRVLLLLLKYQTLKEPLQTLIVSLRFTVLLRNKQTPPTAPFPNIKGRTCQEHRSKARWRWGNKLISSLPVDQVTYWDAQLCSFMN